MPSVLDRKLDAHRSLTLVLFSDLRRQAGDASDDEHELARGRRESEVVKDRRKRAVDVHRQRLDGRARGLLEGAHEGHACTGDPFGLCHVEQRLRAGIRSVHTVSQAR